MPWTDVPQFRQAARIVERVARDNAGVLIDPIHFDRGDSRADEIPRVPPGACATCSCATRLRSARATRR